MRRRNMLGDTAKLTLSTNSYSASPGASTQYVYAYYGGTAITDLTSSMISNSNTSLMSFSVNSSGRITVSINSQNGNTSSRSGSLTLTYQGQQQVFSVTQAADYVVSTQTITGTTCDTCNAVPRANSLFTVSENSGVYTNSQFTVKIGEKYNTSRIKSTYASGVVYYGDITKSNIVNEYVTVGTGELPIASVPTSVGYWIKFSSDKTFTNSDGFRLSLSASARYENVDTDADCSGEIGMGYFELQNASTKTYRFYLVTCGL